MAYADQTKVEIGTTKAEIEKLMTKAGATAFVVGQDGNQAKVMFRLQDRMYRFELTVPDGTQAARTRWRALLLILKAKIEAVNTGIVSLEDEFLAQTMMRDGETVGQKAKRQIDEHYRVGGAPQLLLSAHVSPQPEGQP